MKNNLTIIRICLLIFLASGLSVFLSCNKKKTKVDVMVIDIASRALIKNAKVYLVKYNETSFGGPSSNNILQEKVTDENGSCSFEFSSEIDIANSIIAEADGYFSSAELNDNKVIRMAPHKKNFHIIGLRSKGFLKIHIANKFPFNSHDEIIAPAPGSPYIFNYFYGTSIDTTYLQYVVGNTKAKYAYSVTKNNVTTTVSNEIFCAPLDTVFINIEY